MYSPVGKRVRRRLDPASVSWQTEKQSALFLTKPGRWPKGLLLNDKLGLWPDLGLIKRVLRLAGAAAMCYLSGAAEEWTWQVCVSTELSYTVDYTCHVLWSSYGTAASGSAESVNLSAKIQYIAHTFVSGLKLYLPYVLENDPHY